jgi:hypothetical protein
MTKVELKAKYIGKRCGGAHPTLDQNPRPDKFQCIVALVLGESMRHIADRFQS